MQPVRPSLLLSSPSRARLLAGEGSLETWSYCQILRTVQSCNLFSPILGISLHLYKVCLYHIKSCLSQKQRQATQIIS